VGSAFGDLVETECTGGGILINVFFGGKRSGAFCILVGSTFGVFWWEVLFGVFTRF